MLLGSSAVSGSSRHHHAVALLFSTALHGSALTRTDGIPATASSTQRRELCPLFTTPAHHAAQIRHGGNPIQVAFLQIFFGFCQICQLLRGGEAVILFCLMGVIPNLLFGQFCSCYHGQPATMASELLSVRELGELTLCFFVPIFGHIVS